MTKEEFISKLKEKKQLKTAEEVIEIALPIVQFYLNNYQSNVFKQIKDKFIEIDFTEVKINIPDTPERINLTNLAYVNICNRVEEFENL
jgi:3-polyprenyl-4-hydroxybenzoate decarboxylase